MLSIDSPKAHSRSAAALSQAVICRSSRRYLPLQPPPHNAPHLPAPSASLCPLPSPQPRRMVVVHTADGKQVPLEATQQQIAHVRTGQQLTVTGSWRADPTVAAAPAAAAGRAAGRPRFSAASVVASGSGPVAPPPRLTVQPAAGRHLLQTPVVRSTNQLISAGVPTVFIPSEFAQKLWLHVRPASLPAAAGRRTARRLHPAVGRVPPPVRALHCPTVPPPVPLQSAQRAPTAPPAPAAAHPSSLRSKCGRQCLRRATPAAQQWAASLTSAPSGAPS